ncbi:hypothetical protein MTO96_002322 [Rhipicephalus appendiculatus]
MSAGMLLLAIVDVLACCYFVKVRANADRHLTEHLPDGLPTTKSGGVSPTLASTTTLDPRGWTAQESREFQMVFWIGCTMALLSVACCLSCQSCCSLQTRYYPGRSRQLWTSSDSPIQVQTSRNTVQPASAQLGLVTGTATSPTTYGTAMLPFPSPGDSPHGSRDGYFGIGSAVPEPHREEDEFGYRVQLLQPASEGLPSYDSVVCRMAHPYVMPWPGPQHPGGNRRTQIPASTLQFPGLPAVNCADLLALYVAEITARTRT